VNELWFRRGVRTVRYARMLDEKVVLKKMIEYRDDPDAFFRRYGGGPSIGYDLIDGDGNKYPPAAIAQAALGLKDIKGGLKHSDSAGVALKANGFRVVAKGKFSDNSDENLSSEFLKSIEDTERRALNKVRVRADTLRRFCLKHREVCEVTELSEPELLRVSHIVPWAEDAKCRLDPDNVILLSSLWDAAFDRGLVSFDDDGNALFSARLSDATRAQLISSEIRTLAMNETRARYLKRHREKHHFE
jgi:hypothetical protein